MAAVASSVSSSSVRVSLGAFYRREELAGGADCHGLLGRLSRRMRGAGGAGRGRRQSRTEVAKSIKTIFEALETRQLMSVLPAPTITNWPQLSTGATSASTVGGNEYNTAPSTSVNPKNPLEAVTVWQFDNPQATGTQKVFIRGSYTTDGGVTWTSFSPAGNMIDPVASANVGTTSLYVDATDASVGFDVTNHFYVSFSEHSADNTSGAIVVQPYDLSGGTPVAGARNVVYQWAGGDQAWSPTLAVDTNQTYTDPVTGATTTDNHTGSIYVAWASQDTRPTGNPDLTGVPFNANTLVFTASSDGAATFTAPMTWNSNGHLGGNGTIAAASPKIAIGGDGTVNVVWDDVNGGRGRNTPQDDIYDSQATQGGTAQQFLDPNTPVTISDPGPQVILNNPSTTLNLHNPQNNASDPLSVVTGTLDAGTTVDMMVLNNVTRDLTFLHGNGDGTFAGPRRINLPGVQNPSKIVIGDFDGDGKAFDVAILAQNGIFFAINDNAGNFAVIPGVSLPVVPAGQTAHFTSIAAADIDGDKTWDIATTVYVTDDVTSAVLSDKVGVALSGGGFAVTQYDSEDQNFSNNTPTALADNGTVTSTIAVPALSGAALANLRVGIDLTHGRDSDLVVTLIAPDGVTRVQLVNQRGGAGQDFAGTVFDDNAGTAIAAGTAPFSGTFVPEQALGALTGTDPHGTWTLEVQDTAAGKTGTLLGWNISFNVSVSPSSVAIGDVDGDGTLDVVATNAGDGTVGVMLNDGANNFLVPSTTTNTVYTAAGSTNLHAVRLANVGGGTGLDVLALADNGVYTFVNTSVGGTFGLSGPTVFNALNSLTGKQEQFIDFVVADVGGTNSQDLVITSQGVDNTSGAPVSDHYVLTAFGTGTGAFARPTVSTYVSGTGGSSAPTGLATGLFNGDALNDVVVTNANEGTATVFLAGTATVGGVTDIPLDVNFTDPNFSLSNLEVKLRLTHANTEQLRIELIAPNGLGTFLLLNNRVNAAGNVDALNPASVGITGANMGYVPGTAKRGLYTIFDDQAARNINDASAAAGGFVGRFMPEGSDWTNGTSTFGTLLGKSDAQLSGTWTLRITDTVGNNSPVQRVDSWGIVLTSGATATAENKVAATTVLGAVNGTFPRASNAAGVTGIGPGAVVAVDSTLGSFSPHQGRIYVAYVDRSTASGNPSDNTDVMLTYSDDGGTTWGVDDGTGTIAPGAIRVNDDDASTDGYSGAVGAVGSITTRGRPQFQPALAVDQATGTLVATFSDARRDANSTSITRFIATSIDGGATFGKETYLNEPYRVLDAIKNQFVTVGPFADNGTLNVDPTYGLGNSQGLAVMNGHVYATWSGNRNGSLDGRMLPNIWTATTTIAAGPRAISGTMGVVSNPLTTFTITFDRPVDPATISAGANGNVKLFYRDPVSGAISPVATLDAVTPVDLTAYGATTFTVTLAVPAQATGTYMYLVGPDANGAYPSDAIRQGDAPVTTSVSSAPGSAIPSVGTGGSGTSDDVTTDSVTVAGVPAGQRISAVRVTVDLTHTFDADLVLTLIAPNGTRIVLSNQNGAAGADYTGTVFDDTAPTSIDAGAAPFTGSFQPDEALSQLNGLSPNGTWTLEIVDTAAGDSGTLVDWTLDVDTVVWGNQMDQNGDAVGGEAPVAGVTNGDTFGIPTPTVDGSYNGTFFDAPFDVATLPMIVAGPHVTGPLADALTLNGTVSFLDVTFDRGMDASTIYDSSATPDANGAFPVLPGVVLSFMGPIGPVSGPITALVQDAGTDKVFRFFFPKQTISGDYRMVLSATIKSEAANGYLAETMDNNQDGGVDGLLLRNPVTNRPVTYNPAAGSVAVAPGATVSSSITVGESYFIQGIRVRVNVTDADTRTLNLTLVYTDGTNTVRVPLAVGAGGIASANFTNTLFDDAASTPVANSTGPFFGRFNPQQALMTALTAALTNPDAKGTWSLEVENTSSSLTATINNWSLYLDQPSYATGLGTGPADQATVGFRIFTMDPTNAQSTNTWTAVGPAAAEDNSGRIGGLAVDPSDASGNTFFAAGASGGVWKTTNFLTSDPTGPTWVPLTDFGPTTSLNIGSLAVFGRNGDPQQSIVFAATGEGDTQAEGFGVASPGVGFLRSMDGGKTWTVLDSLVNTDSAGNLLPLSARGHEFVGSSAFKVVVDPRPTPSGDVIVYAAMSTGLYRSLDAGNTWTLLKAGECTDIAMDLASTYPNAVANPTGNIDNLFAAFQGSGVFMSTNRGLSWSLMAGGLGNPLLRDGDNGGGLSPVPVGNGGVNPNGAKGRIVLASPGLSGVYLPDGTYTGNSDWDKQYQGWLYAMVATPDNKLDGIYMTKDFGQNWTKVRIPSSSTTAPIPSNSSGDADWNLLDEQGNYDMAMAIDPTNPSVVYVAGQEGNVLRIDTTLIADAHAMFLNQDFSSGLLVNSGTTVGIKNAVNPPGLNPKVPAFTTYSALNDPMLNLLRDPQDPFGTASTVYLRNNSGFVNSGMGSNWKVFSDFFDGGDYHEFVTIRDPQTGLPRLIVGNDHVVATVVDNGGDYLTSIGGTTVANSARTGNLQLMQFYYGAVQPSDLAAMIVGARFYGSAQDDGGPTSGDPLSGEDPINDGFINWDGGTNEGDGGGIATDQQGSGTVFHYEWPCCGGNNTDFFTVDGVGRTFGLLQAGDDPGAGRNAPGQWPNLGVINFLVNPINSQQIVIGSTAGRVFTTSNQGIFWNVLANPSQLDSTQAMAFAYGAPDPASPTGSLNSFIYIGTNGGHVYVTLDGATFTKLGGPNTGDFQGAVKSIIANPTRGSHEVYVVTTDGVYHIEDVTVPNAPWVNITGDLFSHTINAFGDSSLTTEALGANSLSSMAADWRYTLPDAVNSHPVLYVSGLGGVFRSLDDGAHWTAFPNQAVDGAPADGGYMPVVQVTDLDLALGNIDPNTGQSEVSTGSSLLVATTYGRGTFAIRLAPLVFGAAFGADDPITGDRTITGRSQINMFGNSLTFKIYDASDPNNLEDITGASLTGATVNPDGTFSVSVDNAFAGSAVAIQAVDAAGVYGPLTTLLLPPATPSAPDLASASDSGDSNSDDLTNVTKPTVSGTVGAGNTANVYVDGTLVANVASDATTGAWTFTLTTALTPGAHNITVSQTDAQSQSSAQSPALVVSVDTAGPVGTTPAALPQATLNVSTAFPLATFVDAHKVSSVTINWGDGSALQTVANPGILLADGTPWVLSQAHTYASSGSKTITVTAKDNAGNVSAVVTRTATVVAPPHTFDVILGQAINPSEGSPFSGRVAVVQDSVLAHTAANISATINWGDGTSSAGTIVANGDGQGRWDVLGTHTYIDNRQGGIPAYVAVITVNTTDGDTKSVQSIADVSNVAPTPTASTPAAIYVGQTASLNLSATDPSSADTAAGFDYSINWGDGTAVQTVSRTPGNAAGITVSHTFNAVSSLITVTVTDKDGGVRVITQPVAVSSLPALSGSAVNGNAGRSDISQIDFTVSNTSVAGGVSLANLNLYYNGDGTHPLSLAGAALTFDPASGHGTLDLSNLVTPLADGDYQLHINVGGKLFFVSFFKLRGDLNGSGKVDSKDLTILNKSLGKSAGQAGFNAQADLNHDGVVNGTDVKLLKKLMNTKATGGSFNLSLQTGKPGVIPTLDFGSVKRNTNGGYVDLVIKNTNTNGVMLNIGKLTVSNTNFNFALPGQAWGTGAENQIAVLSPGKTMTVRVYLKPVAKVGNQSGKLKFSFATISKRDYMDVSVPLVAKITT